MNFFKFILLLILLPVITNCASKIRRSESNKINVQWELVSNYNSHQDGALACFTFRNAGTFSLKSSNWVLFFNMAPRPIIQAPDTSLADVMHINGDWYKLVPRNNFLLKPGEQITLYYQFRGCIIKESDAPSGLYFVLYDEAGTETDIVPVDEYHLTAFTRQEQMKCSETDSEDLPGPGLNYSRYELLNEPDTSGYLPVIPSPVKITQTENLFSLDRSWSIQYDPGLETEGKFLQEKLRDIAGLELSATESEEAGGSMIRLVHSPVAVAGDTAESYRLSAEEGQIRIEGSQTGVFYGIQTLLQLLPYEAYSEKPSLIQVRETFIEDAPRFGYRGQHIDVCRNFQTKEQLLKVIDLMARYKLNRLHLYLTEDEAWRIQIKGLPELTEIGSQRGHTHDESYCLPPAYGSGPFTVSDKNYGSGYYTRNDFKEIIRYASERHISVIPSINFPGHARAAIKAMEVRYHRLAEDQRMEEAEEFRLIDPDDQSVYQSAQYYNDNVVCVARESVYHFFETVIDDVTAMYEEAGVPLDMIHTGGDEVPEGVWTRSPLCDTLLMQLPEITDPKNLQNYFFNRILDILHERNLKTGGWEEVVLTKDNSWNYHVNPEFNTREVIPYIWNNLAGSQDLGYRIANAGYPVVLCPVTNFYFDLAYDNDPREPGLYWGGFNEEKDAWVFAPYAMFISNESSDGKRLNQEGSYSHLEKLLPEAEKNILGLQAQLWHETVRGGSMMEYYLLPKIIAFAERCWAAPPQWETEFRPEKRLASQNREWKVFSNSLYDNELPRLRYINHGYNYRIPPPGAQIRDGYLHALAISPGLVIRYTLDDTDPVSSSPVYTEPILFEKGVILSVFDRAGRSGRAVKMMP